MSNPSARPDNISRLDHTFDEELLRCLDQATEQLADEVLLLFQAFMPEAQGWSSKRRSEFVAHAKGRLQAVLAIVGLSTELDTALSGDLEAVGGNAALQGSSLPHLLIVLRISRDLLLQTAMTTARDQRGDWDDAVALFSARLLPVVDRLTDAISTGYWQALLDQNEEERHRLSTIMESKTDPVYEADFDGIVRYVNTAFTLLVGHPADRLLGRPLSDVLPTDHRVINAILAEPATDKGTVQVAMKAADGVLRRYEICTVVRRSGDDILGFGGILRRADDLTAISL